MGKIIQLKDKNGNVFPKTLLNTCKISGTTDINITINGSYNHYVTIPFNYESTKTGTGIGIDGNGIKILKDNINFVRIGATFNLDAPAGINYQIILEKNGSAIFICDTGVQDGGMSNFVLPASIFTCSKNDVFAIKVGASTGGTFNCRRGRSFLTVEEVC